MSNTLQNLYELGFVPDGKEGLFKPSRKDGGKSSTGNKATVQPDDIRETPKLEPNPSDGALGQGKVQERTGQKFFVRVTSFRRRLLDEDNRCEKFHVDLCRYAGVIPGDEASKTKIEVGQVKVKKGEPEKTVIEVFDLDQE